MSTLPTVGPPQPPSRAQRRRRAALYAGLAVAIVAAIVVAALVLVPAPAAKGASCAAPDVHTYPQGAWYAITACDASVPISNSSYVVYEIPRLSDGESILGSFQANLSIGTYILNETQLHALQEDPHPSAPPPSWYWSGGTVTNASLSENLPGSPAQFYVVLENLHATPATVRWVGVLGLYYEG